MKPRTWTIEKGRRFRNAAGQVREVLTVDAGVVLYLVTQGAKNGAKPGDRGTMRLAEFRRWAWQDVTE